MLFKNLKAHVSYSVLTAFSLCIIGTGANAQSNQETPVFTPVGGWEVNKTDLSNVRGLNAMKLPCVITNEFDNGYVMRLSGGGGMLLAMAVDFRQNVFVKGKKYTAMLAVGDAYVKQVTAAAFNPNTLIFNLRPLDGFYENVKSDKDIEIGIDANNMKFAVGDLSKALSDLEGCFAGTKDAPAPMTETLRSAKAGSADAPMPIVPAAAVEAEELPQQEPIQQAAQKPADLKLTDLAAAPQQKQLPRSFDEIVEGGKVDAAPVVKAEAAPIKTAMKIAQPPAPQNDIGMSPMPVGEDVKVAAQVSPKVVAQSAAKPAEVAMNIRANTVSRGVAAPTITPATLPPVAAPRVAAAPAPTNWDAKAGEDMKIVLSRWAERAGYDLDWKAAGDGKVAQDITYTGNFEEAVGQLLAENSAATGIAGHVETPTGSTKQIAKKVAPPEPVNAPAAKAIIPAYHDAWSAPAGANIQTVLGQWADKAGVAVVWQSYMSVPVKNPVNVKGSFEQAVQTLLDQYNNDPSRPVAELNIDPETGERTLLMNLDKSV